jgi:hypothetical protein
MSAGHAVGMQARNVRICCSDLNSALLREFDEDRGQRRWRNGE